MWAWIRYRIAAVTYRALARGSMQRPFLYSPKLFKIIFFYYLCKGGKLYFFFKKTSEYVNNMKYYHQGKSEKLNNLYKLKNVISDVRRERTVKILHVSVSVNTMRSKTFRCREIVPRKCLKCLSKWSGGRIVCSAPWIANITFFVKPVARSVPFLL